MSILRRVIDLLVYGQWQEVEMDPQQPPTIDPERLARIEKAVSAAEDSIAASRQIRKVSDQATAKLATVVRQATGVIGTDLLADRQGRPGQHRSRQ